MNMINAVTLEVRKDKFSETRLVQESCDSELAPNEVLLRVDRLALTSNNITYASVGDLLGYWNFFPAEQGWGRIPAMGWANVAASAHPDIEVGERVWGFFPFTTHLKILAGNVKPNQFSDVSPHRTGYAPFYALFDRASTNAIYDQQREDHDSLLRGLFATSWLVEDFLDVNDNYGASTCIITSASSKTSVALGHCVRRRGKLFCIGVTSPRNAPFCESLGLYDQVLTYDQIGSLASKEQAVLVDMAGSAETLSRVHHKLGDKLKYSCQVGGTHYDEAGVVEDIPGPKPEFFFAPTHMQTRGAQKGAAYLKQRDADYVDFRTASDDWMKIMYSKGPDEIVDTYKAVLAGSSSPDTGQIISI